jgi:hypothetical protein
LMEQLTANCKKNIRDIHELKYKKRMS